LPGPGDQLEDRADSQPLGLGVEQFAGVVVEAQPGGDLAEQVVLVMAASKF